MKIIDLAGTRTLSGEPPRSTAYYYADLERLKRKNGTPNNPETSPPPLQEETRQNPDELSEYVESNEVFNDGAVKEVPPLRDRVRQWSLPEYSTPENSRKAEETYSTAGTFPMPEPKEKEPLLAELEVVGRLPLTQLETSSGVRRSRSWYLCCPNVSDEEMSRESSWRYSSLRPVTAPPMPGQNGLNIMVATHSSGRVDDVSSLRVERDALARALAAERQRASAAARAHDARLAELHGVIAELVRRRAQDKQTTAIPEEEVSDECESTTQPAGELDNDADRSRTDQNESSSILSPAELPTPQEKVEPQDLPDDTTDTSTHEVQVRVENPRVEVTTPQPVDTDNCDTSLNLSEKDSELCLNTARCCQYSRHAHSAGGSCEREHGSVEGNHVYTASPGRCESRQAKLASRVRLRRTGESDSNNQLSSEEAWCVEAAERLALDVCSQADLREALVAASNDGEALSATVSVWRARCARLEADCRVLQCALARATDTAQRLSSSCAMQESACVSVCCALRAADRALEAYDVLLALAETAHQEGEGGGERESAELVAKQLLARLEAEESSVAIGEALLSPGPWLQHDNQLTKDGPWTEECEARLRRHAARLKTETVTLRSLTPPPRMFSYHDIEEDDLPKSVSGVSTAEMEAAVMMQEVLAARELKAVARAAALAGNTTLAVHDRTENKSDSTRSRRRRERHWLDTQPSETDL